ncbi:MAG TPA: ABC transporter ATP-binding protein [Gemmatimonadales bacterium]|nr:ABC transporter ATP-binding protein [Gemmatimonadales bacterium]
MSDVLQATGLVRTFLGGDGVPIEVLSGVDLTLQRGEFVAIVGASGSGKSTLLQLLGALDEPTSGSVQLDGVNYAALSEAALARLRNRSIGFVFQFHHLLREFTALENVMMPLRIAGLDDATARARAAALLESVGLSHRMTHRPSQLSGGEQQRVAVARALAPEPLVVLADEPSGNLDHHHAEALHELFDGLARQFETALVVVTHNRLLSARADRVLAMEAGRLVPASGLEVLPS